jgi:hypothetical protein
MHTSSILCKPRCRHIQQVSLSLWHKVITFFELYVSVDCEHLHALLQIKVGYMKRIFPLTSESRPALRPTQPPVQWVPGVLSPGQSAVGA